MSPLLLSLALIVAAEPVQMDWKVDGVARQALVHLVHPAKADAPVVFVFHGHGGNMRNVARGFHLHELWPEAVVIYPQGLLTATRRDPQGERPGWQNAPGIENDRDLKFFDAMLDTLRGKQLSLHRVYVTGHSNGGGFSYVLWAARRDVLSAIAPSSATSSRVDACKPISVLHIAGRADRIVPFAGQERTMEAVRKLNGCADEPQSWAKECLLYPSSTHTPFVSFIHAGGHAFSQEAPPLIVRFFKEHGPAAQRD